MTREAAMHIQAARSVCDFWKNAYKNQNIYVLKLEDVVRKLRKELNARKTAMANKYTKVEARIQNGMTVSEYEAAFDFKPGLLEALGVKEALATKLQAQLPGVVRNIARAVDEDECSVTEALELIEWFLNRDTRYCAFPT